MDALESLQKIDRTQQIDGLRIRLYFWSRSRLLLGCFAAVCLGLACLLGWQFGAESPWTKDSELSEVAFELAKPAPNFERVLELIATSHRSPFREENEESL